MLDFDGMATVRFAVASASVTIRHAERARRIADRVPFPSMLGSMILMAFGGALQMPGILPVPLLAFVLCLVALRVGAMNDGPEGGAVVADLAIDDLAVVITRGAKTKRVPLTDIERGWVDPLGRAVLRLRNGTDLVVASTDPSDAGKILEAVSAGSVERAVRIPIQSFATAGAPRLKALLQKGAPRGFAVGWRVEVGSQVIVFLSMLIPVFFWGAFGAALHNARHGAAATEVALTAAAALLASIGVFGVLRVLRRREVTVGDDGVAIRGIVRTRFVPYATLSRVTKDDEGVRLHEKNGGDELLPPAPGGDALFERIHEAMARRSGNEMPEGALELLDRNGRSVEAWRAELRRLAARGESYRETALAAERLAEVVGDPDATPERRIGAAVVLAGTSDAGVRRRVRIAIDACADGDMRIALERAAEGEISETELARAPPTSRIP